MDATLKQEHSAFCRALLLPAVAVVVAAVAAVVEVVAVAAVAALLGCGGGGITAAVACKSN